MFFEKSADLSRASSVLDFVVPSSFQQAQQTQQALEPRGLEYSSLQILFSARKKWETAKEESNFEKKNPSRPVPWLLLDQQKKKKISFYQEQLLDKIDSEQFHFKVYPKAVEQNPFS